MLLPDTNEFFILASYFSPLRIKVHSIGLGLDSRGIEKIDGFQSRIRGIRPCAAGV